MKLQLDQKFYPITKVKSLHFRSCQSFYYLPWIHFHHTPRTLEQIVVYRPRYRHLITRNIDNRLYYCVNHYHFMISSSFQLFLLFVASRSASTGLNWTSLLHRFDIVNQILSNFKFSWWNLLFGNSLDIVNTFSFPFSMNNSSTDKLLFTY